MHEECVICGSKNATKKAKIEGVIVNVCEKCLKFGEEILSVEIKPSKKVIPKLEELDILIREDFNKIVKREREKMKLSQEELAKKIGEKESVVSRIEEGWEPPLNIIRKLERFFNIQLTEKVEEGKIERKPKRRKLTIGDIVEIR
jgi:putative transcription factor